MGFLDSVRGAIFTEDSITSAKKPPIQNQTDQTAPLNQPVNRYIEVLKTAIKSRPTALTALIQTSEKLAKVIPDSSTRLKAAFEMVRGEGRGIKELLAAFEIHAADLESQRLAFERSIEKEQHKSVGNLETEISNIQVWTQNTNIEIQQAQQRIATLNDEKNASLTRSAELNKLLENEALRFTQEGHDFAAALDIVKTELDTQKSVIQASLS